MKIFGLTAKGSGGLVRGRCPCAPRRKHGEWGLVIDTLWRPGAASDGQVEALETPAGGRRARRHGRRAIRPTTVPASGADGVGVLRHDERQSGATFDDRRASGLTLPGSTPRRHQSGSGDARPDFNVVTGSPAATVRSRECSGRPGSSAGCPQGLVVEAQRKSGRKKANGARRPEARRLAALALAGRHHLPLDSGGHRANDPISTRFADRRTWSLPGTMRGQARCEIRTVTTSKPDQRASAHQRARSVSMPCLDGDTPDLGENDEPGRTNPRRSTLGLPWPSCC